MDLPMLFRYQDQLNRRIREVRGRPHRHAEAGSSGGDRGAGQRVERVQGVEGRPKSPAERNAGRVHRLPAFLCLDGSKAGSEPGEGQDAIGPEEGYHLPISGAVLESLED